jgi:8-oxo-dGTP diphosphatase
MYYVFRVASAMTLGYLPPLPSVAAIIESRQHLLLVERSDGQGYCLPGGIMRWGESIADTLQREVREETGYLVRPFAIWNNYSGTERDVRASTICLVYTAGVIGGKLRSSTEGTARWVKIEQLFEFSFAFDHECVLKDYLCARNRMLALELSKPARM